MIPELGIIMCIKYIRVQRDDKIVMDYDKISTFY